MQTIMEQLLSLGVVPLLNENDAVSANQGYLYKYIPNISTINAIRDRYELFGNTFSDNDSLAALVSGFMEAQVRQTRSSQRVVIVILAAHSLDGCGRAL